MTNNIFNPDEKPFGEVDVDLGEQHLSGYHQPGEFIEGITKEDVMQLLGPLVYEPIQVLERHLEISQPLACMYIQPLETWETWEDDKALSKVYFEYRVLAMRYNDYHGLAELNLKYPRLNVFINNSGRLCFAMYLPVLGVTIEHLQEVLRDYLRDINSAVKNADLIMNKPTLYIGQRSSH